MQQSDMGSLAQINLDDLVASFGWQERPLLAALSRRAFGKPARIFADQMAEFDSAVGSVGLVKASRLALRHYVRDVHVFDRDRLPAGAFLALSNHPGMTDALSLFAALNRQDLKIIASERPFLSALPCTSNQLCCLADDMPSRLAMVRKIGTHLRGGGAALTFPAGQIEPDPTLHDGAAASLGYWSDSASVLARFAPEAAIVPMLVRGVVWAKADHRWLKKPAGSGRQQDKRTAALQLLAHVVLNVRPVSVRVQIGRPILPRELAIMKPQVIHERVLAEMTRLIAYPPQGEGERVV